MRLKYRMIYVPSYTEFNERLKNGTINSGDIVFVEDIGKIWTHSEFYGTGEGGSGGIVIEDNLLSHSIKSALSANQGRILNETKADLDVNGIIKLNQLPAKMRECVYNEGTWDASTNTPELSNYDSYDNGTYFVVTTGGDALNNKFYPLDVVLKYNGKWIRLCGSVYCNEMELRMITLEEKVKELEEKVGTGGGGDLPPTGDELAIASFTMNQKKYNEVGSSLDVVLSWSYVGEDKLVSQDINGAPVSKSVRSYTSSGVKTDTTFILTARSSSGSYSKELSVKFEPRIYYGASELERMDASDILSLMPSDNVVLANERALGLKVFDCTGGKYVYYIVPAEFQDEVVIKDGNDFTFNNYEVTEVSVTNKYGSTTKYAVFRMRNMYYSSNITFKFL